MTVVPTGPCVGFREIAAEAAREVVVDLDDGELVTVVVVDDELEGVLDDVAVVVVVDEELGGMVAVVVVVVEESTVKGAVGKLTPSVAPTA